MAKTTVGTGNKGTPKGKSPRRAKAVAIGAGFMDLGKAAASGAKKMASDMMKGSSGTATVGNREVTKEGLRAERLRKREEARKRKEGGSKEDAIMEEYKEKGLGEVVKVKMEMMDEDEAMPGVQQQAGEDSSGESASMTVEADEQVEPAEPVEMDVEGQNNTEGDEELAARLHNIEAGTDEVGVANEEEEVEVVGVTPSTQADEVEVVGVTPSTQADGAGAQSKADEEANEKGTEGGANSSTTQKEDQEEKEVDWAEAEMQREEEERGKPKEQTEGAIKENAAAVSFKDTVQDGKRQQLLGAKLKYANTSRFEISANVTTDLGRYPTDDQQAAVAKDILTSVLKRFKFLSKRVAILPWKKETLLPSIEKVEQIPEDLNVVRDYLKNEGPKVKDFRTGRNSRLLVNVTYDSIDGGAGEVVHLWQIHKKDKRLKKYMDIVLKRACMQAESYYALGGLANSSEMQIVDQLEEGLSEELGVPIEIAYRDFPAEYRTIEGAWSRAKRLAGGDIRKSYEYAPQGMIVYTSAKGGKRRMELISKLMQKYGKLTEDRRYPLMPDGSRMRFLPMESMIPGGQRARLRTAIDRHIQLKTKTTSIDMEFNVDINKVIKEGNHKGKTVGELILGLQSANTKYGGVPFFKHFVYKWAATYQNRTIGVAVFEHMAPLASDIMGSLYGVMEKTYGPEVGKEIQINLRGGASLTSEGDLESDAFQIHLDEDDWFDGGRATFIMTGIFEDKGGNDSGNNGQSNAEAAREREEERRLIIASETTEKLLSDLEVISVFTEATDATGLLAGKQDDTSQKYQNEQEEEDDDDDEDNEDEDVQSDISQGEEGGTDTGVEEADKNENENKYAEASTANTNVGTSKPTGGILKNKGATSGRPRPEDAGARGGTGRGRGGGRGNYRGGQRSSTGAALVSPLAKSGNKEGQSARDGIVGGSGTNNSTENSGSTDWVRVGTSADSKNLLEKMEQAKDPDGKAGGGRQP